MKPTQAQIEETVTPEGLRERAKIMRDHRDESCARHLELAADKIADLTAVGPVTCLDIKMATECAVNATIERCAQVAERHDCEACGGVEGIQIAAAIRALKEEP